jgi:eukaryotic-like serine/threonine-protein kinase
LAPDPSKFAKGALLGDYEIQSLLGAGGMGEVYRARDLRLRRDVAIKVLPASLASDPDRLRRFEQEATAAAALNHPNILAVYQLGTWEGAPYLVSELLEGATLREEIQRGPLAVRRVTDYGTQIARGLAAAHEKGIVHRDLKPENLFVTKDGRVKILDFGLAKLTQRPAASGTSAPTMGIGTEAGIVMGTAGYMAPEQVRGEAADHRADIFAFGAILYEMLTGKRAFQRSTSAETMTAILKEDPPGISQVAPASPPALQRVVHRCLEKNPERRFQSASDLAFALEALSDSGGTASLAHPSQSKAGEASWRWLAVVLAAVVVGGAIWAWLSSSPRPPRILATTQLTHDGFPKNNVLTDGSRLYLGEGGPSNRIAQVSVSGGDTSPIPTPFANAVPLDISFDHTKLLVVSRVATEAQTPLWSLPLPSGAPRRLADLVNTDGPTGATWSPDGQSLIFAKGNDVFEAGADGSNPHKLFSSGGVPAALAISPDGSRISFTVRKSGTDSLWEARRDGTHSHALFRTDREPSPACCGNWSADGRYFLFVKADASGSNLWVMREPVGVNRWRSPAPVRLTSGPLSVSGWAISPDGKKVFVGASQGRAELVRFEPVSKQFVPFLSGISGGELDYSRDGQWITYVSYPDQTLWRSRADGSERLQLTYSPLVAGLPRFSPDGSQIAYIASQPGQSWQVYIVPMQGGTPERLLNESESESDPIWSPDGKKVLFGRFGIGQNGGIYLLDVATRQTSLIPGSERFFSPRWSPDGKYMAALNTESTKLFLFDFKTQTWSDWVTEPGAFGFLNWSRDGKYLYYDIATPAQQSYRRVKVGDHHSELVADLNGLLRFAIPPSFGWSGLAPDGSALFNRDLSTDEIYALDVELP